MNVLMRSKTLFPSFFLSFGVDGKIGAEWALGYGLSAAADCHFSLLLYLSFHLAPRVPANLGRTHWALLGAAEGLRRL